MHIFNLNNKPYLIISAKELLFRQSPLDETMQRIHFSEIKKINFEYRYNPQKELFVWLYIQTTHKNTPYIVQISLLDESLEETFSILNNELKSKVKLSFPKSTEFSKLSTHNKGFKRLSFLSVLLFLSLFLYHKLVIPPLASVQVNATKVSYQKPQGFCSNNLKVAYKSQDQQKAVVKSYCGLFGFWKLQESKQVPLKYLKPEFKSYSAKDWISGSKTLVKGKEYQKAILALEYALYLQPEHQYAQVYLSNVYSLEGKHATALSLAKKTVKSYPDYALAHESIAYLYEDEHKLSTASTHFKISIRLYPKTSSYMALAHIQNLQNLKKEALSNYEKALVLSPENTSLLTRLGLAYWDKKEFSKAEDSLQKAYLLNPKDPACFLNYYEATLVTKSFILPAQKNQFVQEHANDEKHMMVYDMLQIIEASIEGKEVLEAKNQWKEKYHSQELDWSFSQMRIWIGDSSLEVEHMQNIQRTLGFFIGHQQAYALKSNNIQKI